MFFFLRTIFVFLLCVSYFVRKSIQTRLTLFDLRQNELEDNLNELFGGVKEGAESDKTRPYKVIKPDPGMYLLLVFVFVYSLSVVMLHSFVTARLLCACVRVECFTHLALTGDGSYFDSMQRIRFCSHKQTFYPFQLKIYGWFFKFRQLLL